MLLFLSFLVNLWMKIQVTCWEKPLSWQHRAVSEDVSSVCAALPECTWWSRTGCSFLTWTLTGAASFAWICLSLSRLHVPAYSSPFTVEICSPAPPAPPAVIRKPLHHGKTSVCGTTPQPADVSSMSSCQLKTLRPLKLQTLQLQSRFWETLTDSVDGVLFLGRFCKTKWCRCVLKVLDQDSHLRKHQL